MSIRLHQETRNKLERLARRNRLKVSDLIREAVRRQLPGWERSGVTFGK